MRQRKVKPVLEENYSQTEDCSEDTETVIEESFEKRTKLRTRTVWTLMLISAFLSIISAGHLYCSVLVVCLVGAIFYEITKLKRNREKEHKLPFFYALRWFWFLITNFYFLRIFLAPQLDKLGQKYPSVEFALKYHQIISYSLVLVGIVMFVLSLRRFSLRYQFQQLSWALVTILVCVIQGAAHIANIYNGLVWFLLPTLLVIVNDIFAYLFGITLGRTPLIKLSPKKTLEGFIGGSIATVVCAVILCDLLRKFPYFMCPMQEITLIPFQSLDCGDSFGNEALKMHGLILATFASLVAPFGGFFASGFKRAFKIKDFSNVFESHGGFTDRFDCQIVMGMFTYIYFNTFVVTGASSHALQPHSLETVTAFVQSLSDSDKTFLIGVLKGGQI